MESVEDVDGLQVEDPNRVAYLTQTTLSLDETRDIMARLYVSEGTFNRQRRSAVQAVARSLLEARPSLATAGAPVGVVGG